MTDMSEHHDTIAFVRYDRNPDLDERLTEWIMEFFDQQGLDCLISFTEDHWND